MSPGPWAHGCCPSVKRRAPVSAFSLLAPVVAEGPCLLRGAGVCVTPGAQRSAPAVLVCPWPGALQLLSRWSAPTQSVTRATSQLSILRGGAMSKALQTWGPFPGLTGLAEAGGSPPVMVSASTPVTKLTMPDGRLWNPPRGSLPRSLQPVFLNLTHLRSGPGWGSPPSVPVPLPETVWCEKNICFS